MSKKEKQFRVRSAKDTIIREKLLMKAIEKLEQDFHDSKLALDVGCGDGILFTALGKMNITKMKMEGMDLHDFYLNISIKKAAENNLEINYFQGSITEIPRPNDYCDFVFCTMMFHHLSRAIKHEAFTEMYRVLKKDGLLVFIDIYPPQGLLKRLLFLPFYGYLRITHGDAAAGLGKISALMARFNFSIRDRYYLDNDIIMIVAKK